MSVTPPVRWATTSGTKRWFMSTACVAAPGAMRTAFVTFVSGVSTLNVPLYAIWAGAEEMVGRAPLKR